MTRDEVRWEKYSEFSTGKIRGSQDEIIDLLAGPRQSSPEGRQMHREVAARIRSVLDDQRLVSLDTLLTVGDALAEKAERETAAGVRDSAGWPDAGI